MDRFVHRANRDLRRDAAELVIAAGESASLRDFLQDRSSDGREAAAYVLCGIHRCGRRVRLLARTLLLPDDSCFDRRTTGSIAIKPEFDHWMLERADAEGLVVVQTHTHPSSGQPTFSSIDDEAEKSRAEVLHRLTKRPLGSVVFDKDAKFSSSRLWMVSKGTLRDVPLRLSDGSPSEIRPVSKVGMDARYDRQVRAFGTVFQGRLRRLRIGIVGVGGLGGLIVEGLARLGVENFVVVDPDHVESSNLNRLPGATPYDVEDRTRKVSVARRNVRAIHGSMARVQSFTEPIPNDNALRALVACDVLVCATDNHASRLWTMEIACAYLRPLINAGVGLDARAGEVKSIGARVSTVPVGGPWCLACGGQIDPFAAARELADGDERELLQRSGYLRDTPAPAVYWVNGFAASEAIRQIHGLVEPFEQSVEKTNGMDVFIDVLSRESFVIDHGIDAGSCLLCGPDGYRGLGKSYSPSQKVTNLPELDLDDSNVETWSAMPISADGNDKLGSA